MLTLPKRLALVPHNSSCMNELQQHILSLSSSERLRLASFILASLSEEELADTPHIPAQWIAEAQASVAAAKRGDTPTYSWEEVKARINGRQ